MRGALYTVGLHTLVIDKLKWVAVVEVVVTVVDYLAVNLPAAEYKVIEHLAADKTYKGGSTRKEVFATDIEIDPGKQWDFFTQRFHRVAETYLAGVHVEPLNIILGKKNSCVRARFRLTDAIGVERTFRHGTSGKWIFGFITVETAGSQRRAGYGYRHHPSEGFVMFHILQSLKY